ncbi:MAG: UDP-N-acetylglucosamine 1-carboxyvinyltransferase, partial [Erysipelotrichaceae bacterium]|nr:UDP-N-acetylglucosamine 1-carboxyvinyltransferase [Erysipelotrichaceae bacterium]
ISDVNRLINLLEALNIHVTKNEDNLIIDPSDIKNVVLDHEDVSKLRASYYFMGALLGRFKYVKIKMPGGCDLGPRPIDYHLKGFEALGATVEYDNEYYTIYADEIVGNHIYLDFPSVGATINIILAAVHCKGRMILENAAKEPEIIDVITMLNKMGAKIRGAGTNEIIVDGVEKLGGCFHEIIPDRIESGTYILMAAAMASEVKVTNVIPQHIESLLLKLKEMGVKMDIGIDSVTVYHSENLKAVNVKTQPYPGFATDLQAPISVLLTQAEGVSEVEETIYKERNKHCFELEKMGAKTRIESNHFMFEGPCKLKGCEVEATDLRAGAAMIIAGLIAEGCTTITNAYHIYRGYEGIKEKLTALGAVVK